MKKFEFSKGETAIVVFNGRLFYNAYKDSPFLQNYENVERLLTKSHELRHSLKTIAPGKSVLLSGMYLNGKKPLSIRKTGPGVMIEDYEFTTNRLTGLTAAYVYENRQKFPVMQSSEAAALGLTWDDSDNLKCKLFLSAITGSEHFVDQFSFWPLLCALRKFQLAKLPEELVVKVARIKNSDGVRLATLLIRNFKVAANVWAKYLNSKKDLPALICKVPKDLKRLFTD